ncbi:MAG: signal peptidase I [Candidatus Promineifilaceae bacterium]
MADSAETVPVYHNSSPHESTHKTGLSYDTVYPNVLIEIDDADEQDSVPQSNSLIAREIIETFLLTLLIFWVVNTMTGRFRIEGSSMMPTMQEGEYVLINKMAYWLNEPTRGDIIVLHYPRDPSRDFIKRIIGVPGDVIEVKDNLTVTVNGTVLTEPYINAKPSYGGRWEVPQGQVFVLGDNRNNSSDSHTWGFLDEELIVGKGWAVYWPVNEVARIPHFDHIVNESPVLLGGQ